MKESIYQFVYIVLIPKVCFSLRHCPRLSKNIYSMLYTRAKLIQAIIENFTCLGVRFAGLGRQGRMISQQWKIIKGYTTRAIKSILSGSLDWG